MCLTEPITPPPRIPRAAHDRHPVGDPSYRLGHLTSTSPATIIFVADVLFGVVLSAAATKELLAATQP